MLASNVDATAAALIRTATTTDNAAAGLNTTATLVGLN